MTYDDQNVFSFHLNESLWFKRGQEVDEFMGISLEPDIAIQENDDTVSIRGVIELAGEYFQTQTDAGVDEEETQILSLRDHASKRTIENIDTHEDGVSEFYHRFPVEVSIPKHRIQSLEDVTVSVDSFDYELPEQGHLKLNATVAIHGVQEEIAEEEHHREEAIEADELEESFTIDQKFEEPAEEPAQDTAIAENEGETDEEGDGRWNFKKKSQSFAEFFGHEQEEEETQEMAEEDEAEYVEYYEEDDTGRDDEIEVIEHQSESEEDEKEQDARYLTSIFQREEEPYAKMKMCIVQEEDTLGTIAQRYKVPPMHLSRVNKLGDDDVSAGQILYIPTTNQ